jgi:hypothetical protein
MPGFMKGRYLPIGKISCSLIKFAFHEAKSARYLPILGRYLPKTYLANIDQISSTSVVLL